jgi:dipeptidyl aminopeptidase/acylaminoacyl peptidase
MEYRGGANLTDIATDISQAAGGWCKTLLKETRERQIAAGGIGQGRVLICIQGGVNSGDWSPSNPAAAITAVESIKTSLKAQWAALGYPATDLYFLFMVSHTFDAGDASLTVLRTYAQAYYTNSTDTLFVNLNDIAPYTKILSNKWYDPSGNAHLAQPTRGYEAISSAIVASICRFA